MKSSAPMIRSTTGQEWGTVVELDHARWLVKKADTARRESQDCILQRLLGSAPTRYPVRR